MNEKCFQTTSSIEHSVDTTELFFDLNSLSPNIEYSIWVVAVNENGAGAATEEQLVRTFSALPSDAPSNITFEPSSTVSMSSNFLFYIVSR